MNHEIKYCVHDEANDNWSPLYDDEWEAQRDLDNDISYAWSTNAKVLEVAE